MVDIVIDGDKCSVPEGTTILEASRNLGINIPTLCYHPGLPPEGNCRLCSVEITEKGRNRIVMSCMFPIEHSGIEVTTFNERIRKYRAFVIEMLLKRAPDDPGLTALAKEYGVSSDEGDPVKEENEPKCLLCGLCVRACAIYGNSALSFINRGWKREVSTPFDEPSMSCIGCGACAEVCPVNFIKMEDRNGIRSIWGRDFALVRCSICGKYFATEEQLAATGDEGVSEPVCQKCRRLEEARIISNAVTRS